MPASRVILCILDGWGIAPPSPGNAITLAEPATFNRLWQTRPHSQLEASGVAVGLPAGQDGNTETGHLNISAGRIVYQDLARINLSIADGSFFTNPTLLQLVKHVQTHASALHIMGLITASGVHAYNDHLFALLILAAQHKLPRVYLHLFTDGRDSPPQDGLNQIKRIQDAVNHYHVGQIVSLAGRYYAMDRDQRLERTQLAFDCLTKNLSPNAADPLTALEQSYAQNLTDEFVKPISVGPDPDQTRIKAGDGVIFYNFRIDRSRQLTKMLLDAQIPNLFLTTMTRYHHNFNLPVVFPDQAIKNTLGEVVSQNNLKQLRAAESEKERFVTYYFNGLQEDAFPGEERLIVPSPKVATYDLIPEMSTPALIDAFILKWQTGTYHLGVINIACPDMVAHTGLVDKTILAVKAADIALERLSQLATQTNALLFVTGDHGNAEELINRDTGNLDTEHSTSPVPLIIDPLDPATHKLENGVLADIASTILPLLNLPVPPEMTGQNLLYT